MRRYAILWLLFALMLCSGCRNGNVKPPKEPGSQPLSEPTVATSAAAIADRQSIPGWDDIEQGFEAQEDRAFGLMGYMVCDVYKADLNGDGTPEICVNSIAGSGIAHRFVQCYEAAADQYSMISDRMKTDYFFRLYDGVLYLIARGYVSGVMTVYRPVLKNGSLTYEDIDTALRDAVLEAVQE